MSTPTTFVEFSRQRGLSPDGTCKVVRRVGGRHRLGRGRPACWSGAALGRPAAPGTTLLGVIRGSAVSQDGASNGPHRQRALPGTRHPPGPRQRPPRPRTGRRGRGARHRHPPRRPIEANALLATCGQDRDEPLRLRIDQVETSVTHRPPRASRASSRCSRRCAAESFRRRAAWTRPTPHVVTGSAGAVELVAEHRAWPEVTRPRRAAVPLVRHQRRRRPRGPGSGARSPRSGDGPAARAAGAAARAVGEEAAGASRRGPARMREAAGADTTETPRRVAAALATGRTSSGRPSFGHRPGRTAGRNHPAALASAAGGRWANLVQGAVTGRRTVFVFRAGLASGGALALGLVGSLPVFAARLAASRAGWHHVHRLVAAGRPAPVRTRARPSTGWTWCSGAVER